MNLPIEIINLILSFREPNPVSILIKHVLTNSYEQDHNPYYMEYYYYDNYCNHFTYKEWYFKIIRVRYNKYGSRKYRHTPTDLPIGHDCIP